MESRLSGKTVLILSHYYKRTTEGGGPPQEMRDYMVPRAGKVVYIEHPFPYADDHRSSMMIYEKGKLVSTAFTWPLAGPQAWYYIADIFITWYFLLKARTGYDLCVALDNLNVFSVLPWKWFGKIKQLAYYTIDYTPVRFTQPVLNRVYHWIDRVACYQSDVIWVLAERMVQTRKEHGVDPKRTAPSVLLPMGAQLDRITPLPITKIHRHQLIFVGHLLEKQGLQLVLEALPAVIKKVSSLKLIVVGQGEYRPVLEKLVKNHHLEKSVDFKGFVEKHTDVEALICQSAIGVAPYLPEKNNYTYYTDPGKPKLYLGCGLPVIITEVPASAKLIAEHRAGIVVDYTKESLTKALLKLLTDDQLYRQYRDNALELSKEFNTTNLIERAINQTINQTTNSPRS